jgi:sterol desaturase/sphingolipid hydroxylase (fatty acid hydroxylase superfamily)
MWTTEVIPTILFCIVFNASWIFVLYYIWAAFLQDTLEHSNLNWYPLTMGKWHMVHHKDARKNFGLFLPIWDKIFKTEKYS